MRFLDQQTKDKVQAVIDANMAQLTAVEGFVSAEPGFPIVDGTVHKEPAVIVFVAHKKPPTSVLLEERVPRQLGPYRVSVMQADPLRQVMTLMSDQPIADSVAASASGLTYKPIAGNPINATFKVKKPIALPCRSRRRLAGAAAVPRGDEKDAFRRDVRLQRRLYREDLHRNGARQGSSSRVDLGRRHDGAGDDDPQQAQEVR